MSYDQCVGAYGVSRATIATIIKAFAGGGIDAVLARKRSVNSDQARRKVDGRTEARLIEIACGPAPEGHSRWTIRLLEDQMKVILDEPISREAIRRALKKNRLRPHRSDYWCIPSIEDADFIAAKSLDFKPFSYTFAKSFQIPMASIIYSHLCRH